MRWTELLALLIIGLLSASLILVPLLLVWSRRRQRRDFDGDPDRVRIRSRAPRPVQVAQVVIQAVQTALQSRLITQLGMVQRLTVVASGYLRARLRPEPGAALLNVGEEKAPIATLNRSYHLEVQHQEGAPASYRGATVRLSPSDTEQCLDLVVEGEGFAVSEGGRAALKVQPAGIAGTRLTVRPTQIGPATLRIDCYRGNAWLQSLDLRVEVRTDIEVAALGKGGTPVADLESSATVPTPPAAAEPRHLHLRISRSHQAESGGAYAARMSDGGGDWHTLKIKLSEEDLREINQGLRLALEDLRRSLGGGLDLPAEQRTSLAFREQLDHLARRGNYAFKQIFPEPGDQAYVRAALSASKKGAEGGDGVSLEIATEGFFLPWELLYDGYDPKVPPDPECFWGFRYAISRLLTDVRQSAPPVLDFAERPRIALFADPALTAVAEQEIPFLRGLSRDGRITLSEWPGKQEPAHAELTERQLRSTVIEFSAAHESEMTHFACHAVSADYGPESYLRLADNLRLRIEDMAVEDLFLAGAPFVLLNACGTGIRDPLKTSDFVRRFLLSGARGVLVTECDVPDGFAAAFIRELYGRILNGERFVPSLLEVRRDFLRQHGNPLGLLYTAYVPLEARLNRKAPEEPLALV